MYLVRSPYLLKIIYRNAVWNYERNKPVVYITFDDGPIPEVTPWVLGTLKEFGAKATFFCIGDNIRKHNQIFDDVIAGGHTIANHTFNHLDGWKTSEKDYINNIKQCHEQISKTAGSPHLFRPPYGKIRPGQIRQIEKEFNYKVILWDVLSGDYDKHTSPEQCLQNVLKNVKNGSIIVFHDSLKAKANLYYALPRVLQYLQDNQYQMLSLN